MKKKIDYQDRGKGPEETNQQTTPRNDRKRKDPKIGRPEQQRSKKKVVKEVAI
jgi:hypothetical protein